MALYSIAPPAQTQSPTAAIVLLHGWGATAQDLAPLAAYLNLPSYQFICVEAPFAHRHVPTGKAWYDFPQDFRFASTSEFRDRPDVSTSRRELTQFLKTLPEQTGIPLSQTFLGGFSQGGAMTLDVGLDLPLAGLMVLSGYLHAPLQPQATQFPPMLQVHGRQDEVVPLFAAHQAREALRSLSINLRYQEFDMGHEIAPVVLQEMRQFVLDQTNAN